MHLSTLFSNLLVAAQLISLPSFAHGRFLAEDGVAHRLDARQTCAVRNCQHNVQVLTNTEYVLEELDGEIGFTFESTWRGGVNLRVTNGIGVGLHVTITGFNGGFTQVVDIGANGATVSLNGAYWQVWNHAYVQIAVTYRAPLGAKAKAGTKPSKAGAKRDLLGEAIQYETADTPKEKPHVPPPTGKNPPAGNHQPTTPNPKGKGQLPYNESKPKTPGGCPGSCPGSWKRECHPTCG